MFPSHAVSPSITSERYCADYDNGSVDVDEILGSLCNDYVAGSSFFPFLHLGATNARTVCDDGSLSFLDSRPGEVLPKDAPGVLAVRGKLGTGTFSEVFSCDMVGDDGSIGTYALKMPTVGTNVNHEVETQRGLSHPNIVRVFKLIQNPLAIVLELCPGGSLQQALHSKSVIGAMDAIGVKARVEALFGVASALAYIHSQNLVHRDVKTGNVLLATPIDGGIMPQLKLSDFGFSKTVGTDMTQYKGTVRYMAPEVMCAAPYSLPADVYSFSMLLYETVTGRPPFHAQRHLKDLRLIMSITNGLRPDLTMCEDVPVCSEVARIIATGWSAEPEDRPSAIDLMNRLSALTPSIPENLKVHVSDAVQ